MWLAYTLIAMLFGLCAAAVYIKDNKIAEQDRAHKRIIKLQSEAYDDILENGRRKRKR